MEAAKKQQDQQMTTMYAILFAISTGHMLNDSFQAVVAAMFPILESSMGLTYAQIGWIAFVVNMTSSVMQPVFGLYADKKPTPFLLPFGMFLSLIGLVAFAYSPNFYLILLSVLFIGLGSAVFHPEGSRVAYMAAGKKRGLAQSIYQVGGNAGQSLAPIFTAYIFVPLGQIGAAWFAFAAGLGIIILSNVSKWYKKQIALFSIPKKQQSKTTEKNPMNRKVKVALILLIFLVFARSWYSAGIGNFYQFYLIGDYGLSIKQAQLYVFIYMIAGVIGTLFGGSLGDRFGRRNIIFLSLFGAAPLTLALPHVPLYMVIPLFFLIGVIVMSSFSVTVVYAQELVPNKIGMVSGLIVGLAFGMGAIGAVLFGTLADMFSIKFVMILCSVLPLLGIFTLFLPKDETLSKLTA
ncbi:MFS transporter [Bacillus chungangensis]|uniref:FSR family fosmidomycin resistance protein-like MFS transporter n=1 Tax=Bacillus chungangensis TaxID=587633 RepID=A0ABT9WVX8_9BACI|nr:MFS transporter [Bacillus chungangensis]MDQ0177463.1 FSR family fosmidomycin resistance protein-like MFS transporter [Bacillus chungangensis]